jgi:class 3 adenylate cyclase
VADDTLEAGREAIRRHAWADAFDHLTVADARGNLSAEDLSSLSQAAWWTGRMDAAIDAAERAYSAHLDGGDARAAAMAAIDLAHNYHGKGRDLLAAGWLKRAERILDTEPESVATGYLAREKATSLISKGRLEEALSEARGTLEMGTRFADPDLQALGVHDQGRALVALGRVADGWELLDEATVAAVSGELKPLTTAIIYCNTISTCRDLADYGRASQWSDAAKRWCERQAISGFPGMCRVYRAEISRLRGALAEAETEARNATGELMEFNREYAAGALYELGEIRLRLGDLQAAEEAFAQAHELGNSAQPGLSLLRLVQGKTQAAATSIRAALQDETWNRLARARLLPAQVEIAVAAGDLRTAQEAVTELEEIAEGYGTAALRAAAASARGELMLATGDSPAALASLREGHRRWQEVDAPYEAARARVLIGVARRRQGDDETAEMELQAARSVFTRLGAVRDAARVDELLTGRTDAVGPVRRTFMFTDIVRSTPLVEAIGDQAWTDLLRWHDHKLRSLFGDHGGEEIDHTGDGFFVAFEDAGSAVRCAVAIQRGLAEHRRDHGFAPQVRIGIHAAEASEIGGSFRGKGVHEAARIGALAEGDQILASRSSVEGLEEPATLGPARTVSLKGISRPVEVVPIDWR